MKKLVDGEEIYTKSGPNGIESAAVLFRDQRIYIYTRRKMTVPAFSLSEKAGTVLRDYKKLEARSRLLQLRFSIALYVVSLLGIALTLWIALRVADRFVQPVNYLVQAARQISEGDLSVRVGEEFIQKDEVGFLARSFNHMTERLQSQTQALLATNRQLEDRRAFIEAVLESVSAAIVNIDDQGKVRLANVTAENLLSTDGRTILGQNLASLAPYFSGLIADGKTHAIVQVGDGTVPQTLAVKIAHREGGHVVTFEDISQQLADQRSAAWSDVARRIAHEIKNPLTPIQLAAERLQRRFGNQVEDSPGVFSQLTGTIIRQVGDLRNIVDEFSSFARMPKPIFREEDLGDVVGHAVFLFEVAHPEIAFEFSAPQSPMSLLCDRRQVGQAVTNILKNAVEAIAERMKSDEGGGVSGKITAEIIRTAETTKLAFADNGAGFPKDRDRIVEPYVTTRTTGSGLGLAIVKKIAEEHGAEVRLDDNPSGGAMVTLCFYHDRAIIPTTPNAKI
jgi:two-component system, NtrC family, nitrogen regulation sensor histidine kinase NtrY